MSRTLKKTLSRKKTNSDRHNRILAVSQEIFAEKGFIKTTLSDIASQSGVPEASIYDHFSNKEGILFRLAEQFFIRLRKDLQVHFLGIDGVINRFRKLIWHHLHFFQEHPRFCRVYILEIMHNPRFITSEACQAMTEYRRELTSILEEGRKQGDFWKDLDSKLCEAMVFGAMDHMMLSKTVLGKPLDFIQHAEDLHGLFFNAIAATSFSCRDTIISETGTRKKILVAALDEFVGKGFQKSTISQIAKSAQVTEPTIYEHFTSKEELLYSIPKAAMGLGSSVESMNADLENLNTPTSRLRSYMNHHIRLIRDHSDYFYLLVSELRGNAGFYSSPTHQYLRDYSQRLSNIVWEGIQSGDFKQKVNSTLIIDLFFGIMDELTIRLYVKRRLHTIIQSSETIYDLVYNAIRSDPN